MLQHPTMLQYPTPPMYDEKIVTLVRGAIEKLVTPFTKSTPVGIIVKYPTLLIFDMTNILL